MGITYLEVKLDARSVVNLVLSSLMPNRAYSPLLNDCRSMLNRFQQVQVNHIFWEVNSYANATVKKGCLQQETFVMFNSPPSPDISSFVTFDANGVYYVRRYANVDAHF